MHCSKGIGATWQAPQGTSDVSSGTAHFGQALSIHGRSLKQALHTACSPVLQTTPQNAQKCGNISRTTASASPRTRRFVAATNVAFIPSAACDGYTTSTTALSARFRRKPCNLKRPFAARRFVILDKPFAINSADVMRRFDRASSTFDAADFVHKVSREGLFSRLSPMLVNAKTVLDLGCGTGAAIRPLARHFRGARIIGVDISEGMLARCRSRRYWFTKTAFLQADARALPFPDGSVDVVFSNLMLPWVDDLPSVAREVARVLREDGLFVFASLGPDSFAALRHAWSGIDEHPHVHAFLDMHDVGDAMSRGGLRDPVLDVDHLTVTYRDADTLFHELSAAGARNALQHRFHGLTTPARLSAFRRNLQNVASSGDIPVVFEFVYGHCWGSASPQGGGGIRVDANAIPIRRR